MKLPAPFLHVQMGAGDDRRGRHSPGFRSLVDRKKSPFEGPSTIESRAWAAALEFTVKEGTGFCTRQPSASNLATKSLRYERSLSPVSTQPYVEAVSHISGIMPGVGKAPVYTVILFALPSSSGHTRIPSQPSHGQSLLSLDSLITKSFLGHGHPKLFQEKVLVWASEGPHPLSAAPTAQEKACHQSSPYPNNTTVVTVFLPPSCARGSRVSAVLCHSSLLFLLLLFSQVT